MTPTTSGPTTGNPAVSTGRLGRHGLTLGPDGLGVVQVEEGQPATVKAMTLYLGRPNQITTGGCLRRIEVEWNDLSLEFYSGRLSGYRYLRGGLPVDGTTIIPSGPTSPLLTTATGVALGTALGEVRKLYPATDFSYEHGGSIVVPGLSAGDQMALLFFGDLPTTPLVEVKGGQTCGDY
jgi:hypothetical protein